MCAPRARCGRVALPRGSLGFVMKRRNHERERNGGGRKVAQLVWRETAHGSTMFWCHLSMGSNLHMFGSALYIVGFGLEDLWWWCLWLLITSASVSLRRHIVSSSRSLSMRCVFTSGTYWCSFERRLAQTLRENSSWSLKTLGIGSGPAPT